MVKAFSEPENEMLSPEAAAFLSLLKLLLHSASDTKTHSDFLSSAFLSGHRDNMPCLRHKRGVLLWMWLRWQNTWKAFWRLEV